MPASSASGSPATPPSLPWRRSAAGSIAWDDSAISQARDLDDHGGLRRLEWGARAAHVETRTAKARRRNRACDPRPPLSPRRIEVEQDRAPPVLPRHAELARPTAHRSSCRGRADRRNNRQRRAQGRKRARHAPLSKGRQSQPCRDEAPRHHRRSVPSRGELHDQPKAVLNRSTYCSGYPKQPAPTPATREAELVASGAEREILHPRHYTEAKSYNNEIKGRNLSPFEPRDSGV